jgi:hypothetical protein
MRTMARVAPATILAGLLASGCLEFRGVGPEDITPERPPRVVDVTIEYIQPPTCEVASRCDDPVIFFGNWMRAGAEFALTPDERNWVHRGRAKGVPVNFPPHEYEVPHIVRVYDPHLGRFAAYNLKVGGELMVKIQPLSAYDEIGRVYVDENGFGHNVYY